ncbi:hypothetical protein KAR91_45720 [Candidatus Pacearchaeota archaeon]|nr:hypothetical protein [Candidatus Pacearchaeota archaeon]
MASITINSANVIQACDKAVLADDFGTEYKKQLRLNKINAIKELAEFSEKFGFCSLSIDHNDFVLIGEYMTIPKQGD